MLKRPPSIDVCAEQVLGKRPAWCNPGLPSPVNSTPYRHGRHTC